MAPRNRVVIRLLFQRECLFMICIIAYAATAAAMASKSVTMWVAIYSIIFLLPFGCVVSLQPLYAAGVTYLRYPFEHIFSGRALFYRQRDQFYIPNGHFLRTKMGKGIEYAQFFEDFTAKDQSAKAFCQEQGIAYKTFLRWAKQLGFDVRKKSWPRGQHPHSQKQLDTQNRRTHRGYEWLRTRSCAVMVLSFHVLASALKGMEEAVGGSQCTAGVVAGMNLAIKKDRVA